MLWDAADGLGGIGAGQWGECFMGEVAGLDESGDDGGGHVEVGEMGGGSCLLGGMGHIYRQVMGDGHSVLGQLIHLR